MLAIVFRRQCVEDENVSHQNSIPGYDIAILVTIVYELIKSRHLLPWLGISIVPHICVSASGQHWLR